MNTSACRKTRSLQWQRNRFESRKNLTLEQGGSTRSMRCFIEHHPRFYQIYTAQVTKNERHPPRTAAGAACDHPWCHRVLCPIRQ